MTMSCLLISHRLSTYFKCCVIMTFKETIIMAGIKNMVNKVNKKYLIPAVVVAGIILIIFLLFLPRAGHLLVVEDPLQDSDLILVLMGSLPDRIAEGVDIYQEGYAPKIVMVQEDMESYEVLVERGVDIPGRADLSKRAALELRVPEDRVLVIEGNTLSTQDEAVVLRDYLEGKDIESLIIVTSKYHSARAKAIFEKAMEGLDRDIEIISRPSRYDDFSPQGWWRDREDTKRVLLEYLKFFNFYTREQFELN